MPRPKSVIEPDELKRMIGAYNADVSLRDISRRFKKDEKLVREALRVAGALKKRTGSTLPVDQPWKGDPRSKGDPRRKADG
jgi:hypothetical protein